LGWKDFSSTFLATCSGFSLHERCREEKLMAKQTKITIETDSLLILQGRNSSRVWCPQCAAETEMIALENTGLISNLERTALQEWLNTGELHSLPGADGLTLICVNSLLALVQCRNR
jgi:hypothetical protein